MCTDPHTLHFSEHIGCFTLYMVVFNGREVAGGTIKVALKVAHLGILHCHDCWKGTAYTVLEAGDSLQ